MSKIEVPPAGGDVWEVRLVGWWPCIAAAGEATARSRCHAAINTPWPGPFRLDLDRVNDRLWWSADAQNQDLSARGPWHGKADCISDGLAVGRRDPN